MKTLLKLFFIFIVAFIAITTYTQLDTPISTIENAEAIAESRIDLCYGTGNISCAGKLVQTRIDFR